MGKSTTEQAQNSKDKQIVKKLSMQEIYDFLQQVDEDGETTRAKKILKAQYEDAISGSKTAHMSRQDLLDRGFGKAQQSTDITTGGQPLTTVAFDIFADDTN